MNALLIMNLSIIFLALGIVISGYQNLKLFKRVRRLENFILFELKYKYNSQLISSITEH